MARKLTVGIIGFGRFGAFMARELSAHLDVVVSSRSARAEDVAAVGARLVSFESVATANIVIPSVPVQNLEGVLERLAPLVKPGTVVADVASVKCMPVEMMLRILPAHCEILATHPLFGPDSAAKGLKGLPMVLWPVRIAETHYQMVWDFLEQTLELAVQRVSPEEHDQEMAYVQALTFFIGKTLKDLSIPDTPLKTATYQHLLDIRRLVSNDSGELFATIQHFNPYAEAVRERFTLRLDEIEADLQRGQLMRGKISA